MNAKTKEIEKNKEISIIGAGLVGVVLAVCLAKRGYDVEIFEQRDDSRKQKSNARGRSINLAISVRGLLALDRIGLKQEILNDAIPMHGRMVHTPQGELLEQFYEVTGKQAIYSISRQLLNQKLLNFAETFPNIHIYFSTRLVDLDLELKEVYFQCESSEKMWSKSIKRLIGADGALSIVRQTLKDFKKGEMTFTALQHGYKELAVNAEHGKHLAENFLHVWPRKDFMLIVLPNFDGTSTATLFLPLQGENSFAQLSNEFEVISFFKQNFSDFLPLIPDLTKEFFSNSQGSLQSVQMLPWHLDDWLLILGDAAHAMLPFFGQGMNCALEDCVYLENLLDQYHDDWSKVLPAFERSRFPHTTAITAMSFDNYLEMRDAVCTEKFILQKEIEKFLIDQYSDIYIPKYQLVTFSHLPYTLAQKCGGLQQQLLEDLASGIDNVAQLDRKKVAVLMKNYELKVELLFSAKTYA